MKKNITLSVFDIKMIFSILDYIYNMFDTNNGQYRVNERLFYFLYNEIYEILISKNYELIFHLTSEDFSDGLQSFSCYTAIDDKERLIVCNYVTDMLMYDFIFFNNKITITSGEAYKDINFDYAIKCLYDQIFLYYQNNKDKLINNNFYSEIYKNIEEINIQKLKTLNDKLEN